MAANDSSMPVAQDESWMPAATACLRRPTDDAAMQLRSGGGRRFSASRPPA